MSEQFTLKLNSPITDEQWDAITDVDFDNTEEIFFHTKHGKEVTFVKQKKGKWILVHEADETGNATYECSICHRGEIHVPIVEVGYCWHCGADMRGDADE